MAAIPFSPVVELTRGPIVESVHFGALAVVDTQGNLIASVGDPDLVANLRSSSKPFQAQPFVESGGVEHFGLTDRELAICCASHSGTDEHVSVLKNIHQKTGVRETDLQCGTHPVPHGPTARAMLLRGEEPTPIRHNCSGKHTGMLAYALMSHEPIETYLSNDHPIQKTIRRTFAEMMDMQPEDVLIGIDGCSAPTFAAPLRRAALAYARLCDPSGLPEARAQALRHIYRAMTTNPDMVAGPDQLDTLLMQAGKGKIVSKGGAEGYQGIGLAPGAAGPGSPAMGIAIKICDGDAAGRARSLTAVTVLRMLGALDDEQMGLLEKFTPRPLFNWRHLEIGEIRPAFTLERAKAA